MISCPVCWSWNSQPAAQILLQSQSVVLPCQRQLRLIIGQRFHLRTSASVASCLSAAQTLCNFGPTSCSVTRWLVQSMSQLPSRAAAESQQANARLRGAVGVLQRCAVLSIAAQYAEST